MVQFIDLWRAHPFNDGGRSDWTSSTAERHSVRATATALVRTGVVQNDFGYPQRQVEPGAHDVAARLDASRRYGFGKLEIFSPTCENDVFSAIVGRTGVVVNFGSESRIDIWNGQRSATMGLARWVQLLTARASDSTTAPELWFWALPDR